MAHLAGGAEMAEERSAAVNDTKRRRRGAGEGGISKRSDGRYEATVVLGRRDGKPIRKSLYGRTESARQ